MKKITVIASLFLLSMASYAKNIDYIGTRANPIPLQSQGMSSDNLKFITLYLYQDKTFEVIGNNTVISKGTFTDQENSISYSDQAAYSNKFYISKRGDNITCLQTVFYKPDIIAYKTDWFCPNY